MKKILKRVFLALVVLVLLGFFGVPLVVRTGWAREKVRAALEEHTGREVSVGSISFGWFSGLEVDDVVVLQKPGHSGSEGPLFSLDRLSLRLSLRDLLDRKIEIEEMKVDAPRIALIRDRTGVLNISDLVSRPSEERKPGPPVVATLEIEDGAVVFLDQELSARLEASDIEAEIGWRNGELEVDVAFRLNGGESRLIGSLDLTKSPSPMRVESLTIEGAELTADLARLGFFIPLLGREAREASGRLDLHLRGLESSALRGEDLMRSLRGEGDVTLTAGSLLSAPIGRLRAYIETGMKAFRAVRWKDPKALLALRLPTGDSALSVDRLTGTFVVGEGRVRTEDTIIEASGLTLRVSGWTSFAGALEYEFVEDRLTESYRAMARDHPWIRSIVGETPRLRYRKPAGGPGKWEVPWLDPKKLLLGLTGLRKLGEGGAADRLRDLLRRGR